MKLVLSILLSAVVFFSGTKNLLFVVDYHVNSDYYESVCENQNRPEMECHGKCQLPKDTQKTSKTFSFSHFAFDFYAQESEFFAQENAEIRMVLSKIADFTVVSEHEISLGVPNPPPNI